jgi:hypothetical protein
MTAEEKRAHLILHGCVLRTYGPMERMPPVTDHDWRVMHPATSTNLQVLQGWRVGENTTPDYYTEAAWPHLPDELLDRLDESLIERFLSTTR